MKDPVMLQGRKITHEVVGVLHSCSLAAQTAEGNQQEDC